MGITRKLVMRPPVVTPGVKETQSQLCSHLEEVSQTKNVEYGLCMLNIGIGKYILAVRQALNNLAQCFVLMEKSLIWEDTMNVMMPVVIINLVPVTLHTMALLSIVQPKQRDR